MDIQYNQLAPGKFLIAEWIEDFYRHNWAIEIEYALSRPNKAAEFYGEP